LSESEREVTGLVFALAGYLVHDVHETVPFRPLAEPRLFEVGPDIRQPVGVDEPNHLRASLRAHCRMQATAE